MFVSEYFENRVFEAKVEAKLSTMIKNSLMVKKRNDRQAMSMRISSNMAFHKGGSEKHFLVRVGQSKSQ